MAGNAISDGLNFSQEDVHTTGTWVIPSDLHSRLYFFQKTSYSEFYWKSCIMEKLGPLRITPLPIFI
jgi:hypothetical protein